MKARKLFRGLLLSLMLVLSANVSADTFEVDGINYYCESLSSTIVSVTSRSEGYSGDIVIPESVVYNNETYNVTAIGDGAFSLCSGITSVQIPYHVRSIGSGAFEKCTRLTSVKMPPNSLTTIGDWAFLDCSALTSIEIPGSVTTIGTCAFLRSGLTCH